jgi:hypothetical protein
MGKIARTWSLMSACWQVLKRDKGLLVFPLLSGICCLALLASFAVPLYATGAWQSAKSGDAGGHRLAYYALLFLFYLASYFIIVFFNAGVVACATIRLDGGDPTIGDGFRVAATRLPVILGWALVSATVGLILKLIEDSSNKVGRFAAGLLGAGWTITTFLAVPILVVENKNPISALKDSAALLKKTWGEQLASTFSFGILFLLLSLPAVLIVVLGLASGSLATAMICIGLAVLYWIGLALVQSALQSIFQVALYLYAKGGQVPEGFQAELLSGALA